VTRKDVKYYELKGTGAIITGMLQNQIFQTFLIIFSVAASTFWILHILIFMFVIIGYILKT
jgi:hypothetical protein